ncbi:MAG: DUF1579 family protein [Candidatus Eremiobacteraeota bacterium]|nr:DUF1579 family protein [Candidatus Eremiobacteraeota bacterium]
MRPLAFFAALVSSLGTTSLGAGAQSASPVDALGLYRGTWQSSATIVDTTFSKAGEADGTTACDWSGDRLFMICQQNINYKGTPVHDVTIFTYNPETKAYRFYSVAPNRVTDADILVDRNSVTFPSTFKDDNGKTVTMRTVNTWTDSDHYAFRTEYSLDGGAHWTVMLSGSAHHV